MEQQENMQEFVKETIRGMKRQFRLYMNGVTAASMREKGLEYKVNWGISLPDLKRLAAQYELCDEPDAGARKTALAEALWKERSRECRILATLLMPRAEMTAGMAQEWIATVDTQELCELLVFNLLQHADCACGLALNPKTSPSENEVFVRVSLLSRLLARGIVGANEVPDSLRLEIERLQECDNVALAHAAFNCMSRLEEHA